MSERRADFWKSCFTCRDYASRRRDAIAQPLTDKANREGRDVIEVVDEFMAAAHDRHLLTGAPLRPDGPTRVIDPMLGRIAALTALVNTKCQPPTEGEPA